MILSQQEIRAEIENQKIKFDPPIEDHQWAEASINLRLGIKFTKFKPSRNVTFSLAEGISAITDTALWHQEDFELVDGFGKPRSYTLDPDEFILGQSHERMWVPRHLIGMVQGRSTYARAGISVHQTAPWLQPGWNGKITLEIRNSGKHKISLTPLIDKPCQVTFFQLTSEIPEKDAYGSRPSNLFQNQTEVLPTGAKKDTK